MSEMILFKVAVMLDGDTFEIESLADDTILVSNEDDEQIAMSRAGWDALYAAIQRMGEHL